MRLIIAAVRALTAMSLWRELADHLDRVIGGLRDCGRLAGGDGAGGVLGVDGVEPAPQTSVAPGLRPVRNLTN
ncbi:MAG: hypothetical protein LH624_05920 [Cryobacterium sp.]|nr:hypothetical protein [Cryobacterium sp.]